MAPREVSRDLDVWIVSLPEPEGWHEEEVDLAEVIDNVDLLLSLHPYEAEEVGDGSVFEKLLLQQLRGVLLLLNILLLLLKLLLVQQLLLGVLLLLLVHLLLLLELLRLPPPTDDHHLGTYQLLLGLLVPEAAGAYLGLCIMVIISCCL